MKRLIILSLLIVVISFSAFAKDITIVRGNLEYIKPSLVSNISPEYEKYKLSFKLDEDCANIYTKYIKSFIKAEEDIYFLIKEIFPENIIYDDNGDYIISHIACCCQPQTGNVAIYFIRFSRDIYSLNLDNYINRIFEEFSKIVKIPILDSLELDKSSSFFFILKPNRVDRKMKEEQAKSIEIEDVKPEEPSFLDRVWNWIIEIFN